ncbi:MAG TPA: hypothetical protein VGP79_06545 [Bryobacteraceae bacterium]|nr:hypothetical protein [Bryobacteraceae bacterium]
MRAIAFLLTIPLSLLAQQPFISAVVNDATSDAHFSPGSILRFNGADLPLTFSATLDGKPAAQLGKQSTIVARFQLPVDAPIGPATLVANLGGGKTQQFSITLDQFAPSIYEISPFYPVHSGDPHTHCFLGATAPGSLVTATVSGLGPTNPPVATGVSPENNAPTIVKPFITIDGQAVEVLESVLVQDSVGLYRVRFRAPATEGFHSVRIAAGNQFGNETLLPINVGRIDANFSAATYVVGPVAPESLMTAYSCTVAGLTDGVTAPAISITDSRGIERQARVSFFNKFQANYNIPPGTAIGIATLTIKTSTGVNSTGRLKIESLGPGLFGAVLIVRNQDGVQTVTPATESIDVAQGVGGRPSGTIDLSGDGDVFLILFGTGLRFRSALANVRVTIAGIDVPVEYAGAQGQFDGLDQVNLRLPKSLKGIGDATLVLTVDGFAANAMHLRF